MQRLMRVLRLVVELVRELADERAYERHLRAHGSQASPEAWREFCTKRLRWRYGNPRCC